MMIDKRLIGTVRESKKYVAGNVIFQWISLCANIVLMTVVAAVLAGVFAGRSGIVLAEANSQPSGITAAAVSEWAGKVDLAGCLLILLLAADFFIPMRQLGSFFHIAMNGMAASEKIFRLLDLPEAEIKDTICPENTEICCENLRFSYEKEREILRMGAPEAEDARLWEVLERVKLADFLRSEKGLDTELTFRGENFSGGQRQRLALARALLHDSPIYIFDEATSNIDVESENDIMDQIRELTKTKTVILISHRLANVTEASQIYVMDRGKVTERGTHTELLYQNGHYAVLWTAQQQLENYGKESA